MPAATSRPRLAIATLLATDLAALLLAAAASIVIWHSVDSRLQREFYVQLWPVVLLFPLAFAAAGLYPGFGRNPADELRRLCASISIVYPAMAVTIFLLKEAPVFSRGVFVVAWTLTLVIVPLLRAVVRDAVAAKAWWGYPVAIAGPRAMSLAIADMLAQHTALGLKPVALFDDPYQAVPLAQSGAVRRLILAVPSASRDAATRFLDHSSERFADIIVVPELAGFSSLWVETRDLNGTLGLAVRPRLLLPTSRAVRRALDLGLIFATLPFLLLLMTFIAIAIKLTSAGPVFYGQRRFGRNGQPFTAWKFRSMVANASQVLERCLAMDPALSNEWRQSHKLRNDPRITRIGRFLRRTSLDELPQLWNVIRGEMGLVGPRPIVADEIPRYGEGYGLYKKVSPGLTGMWQVSGRNNLSYDQRVAFDLYYVRNWSPWLDLYILARTVKVVLTGDGAY